MKPVIRFLARLYPAAWRRRYGAEFDALLEDDPASWRSLMNVLLGAFKMQLTNWNFVKIVIATAVFGTLTAAIGSFAIPKSYRSTATVRISSSGDGQILYHSLRAVQQQALSRNSLTPIILSLSLYPAERSRVPMENVIERMRKSIMVKPINSQAFTIQFDYTDPLKAQQAAEEITRALLTQSTAIRGSSLEVLNSPTLPSSPTTQNRLNLAAWGLAAGTAVGAMLGLLRFRFSRTVVVGALIGALAGTAGSFAIPKSYRSTAVIRMNEPFEVSKLPARGVLTHMRGRIQVRPIQAQVFTIQLDDSSPVKAQHTLQQAAAALLAENLGDRRYLNSNLVLELIDPAVYPTDAISPNRLAFAGWGLIAGIGVGTIFALFRRPRQAA
ncbi:MAG TPA: hypothetical protein VGP79_12895 [Bryobacteraceae bacterium]|jgi:capsular polysaccharide biosynthesis protein|nr:hypothetical protein [Bryobacteraceae bacterium]